MQGDRASVGSLSETLNFEHGSTSSNAVIDQQIHWDEIPNLGDNDLQNYMTSVANTNTNFENSVYHEQHDLQRLSLCEGQASSSGTKNEAPSHSEHWKETQRRSDKLEWNPLSSGNGIVRNVNLNAEYNEDINPVTGGHFEVNGLPSGLLPENNVRAGSYVDERCASLKRKAVDCSIGQSSSSGGFGEFQRGESSSWFSSPTFYNPVNDLNISLDHDPRGLASGAVQIRSAPTITESPSSNFSFWANPAEQHETVSPALFAAGSVIRRPVAPSLNSSGLLPPDRQQRQLFDQRYGHALGNLVSQNLSTSTTHMMPPIQWSGTTAAAGGSSSSAVPVVRNIIHRDEARQRRNIFEIPLFIPSPELRNPAHSHIATASSRPSVQPSPSNQAWSPHQNNLQHSQRRLSEHYRRSLLSSIATGQRSALSLAPPVAPQEHVLQSGGDNTFQVPNHPYSRPGPVQGQNGIGIPRSMQSLASTSRGRRRMAASEIRNVLDHMRRGGNLRFEDVMLLNQSIVLGRADIHDRYRDMRLDVDNMSYEELLSLEERIGDVCTGLSDEIISNRLKQEKYKSSTKSSQVEPCCICQEEYEEGEDMGILECGHNFHGQCIKEWLKRKNLCPICKTTGLNTAKKPRRL